MFSIKKIWEILDLSIVLVLFAALNLRINAASQYLHLAEPHNSCYA